ncbi:hypothetical protein D187_003840 [Cystobacter fuscus DSM 2262]|uniref:Uncharacterized protein n=1 Tax=Cystobacter fuscus (strain ATCC 25194 / DSM 2262 / NBRC 100088 / M29) TaxID=1242864 RepID=S9P8S7_CYSF2|nr:hypothetical protein [Cystobacter fuscus]EPX58642.1 hypothetical protein D187_003840 [Cystobacter fuscus DSM 2262]
MSRVQLVVTGDMERVALAASLRHAFPAHELNFLLTQKVQDFTSSRLGTHPGRVPGLKTRAQDMAQAIVSALEPGRYPDAIPDMVLAVDDLELVNVDQPHVVTEYLAREIELTIKDRKLSLASETRVRERLRSRASFHLFVPMPEAYFYAEPAALKRAGAKAASRFDVAQRDTEAFEVDDPAYRQWLEKRAPNAVEPHRRHPKQYLRYLCDPNASIERAYRETKEGALALEKLAWSEVTAREARENYARALLEDFAEGIGANWQSPGPVAPLTARRSGGLLRNLAPAVPPTAAAPGHSP